MGIKPAYTAKVFTNITRNEAVEYAGLWQSSRGECIEKILRNPAEKADRGQNAGFGGKPIFVKK